MSHPWHWPQYGMAFWYGLLLFGTVVKLLKTTSADDRGGMTDAAGNIALYLLLIVTLHCGGFW